MKANEAPEKLYLDTTDNPDNVWLRAFRPPFNTCGIEYTRTDAFIEKAEKYLEDQFIKDVSVLAGGVVHINFTTAIKNFVNYIKGEQV